MLGSAVVAAFLCVSVSQAQTFTLFDEDFEDPNGINTTNPGGANYIRPRYPASEFVPPTLSTAQSVSPTHSHFNDDNTLAGGTHTEWFYMIPQTFVPMQYEAWIRLDTTDADSQEIGIWGHSNPQQYAAAARMRRGGSGNFIINIGEAGYADSGIAYDPNTWYHVGFEADPSDGSVDVFISTTASLGAPVASGISDGTNLPANDITTNGVGGMYNYSDSSPVAPVYYIDDVLITRSIDDNATSLNVKDFGAVGNGVTDDTAAIQAAVDYAAQRYVLHQFPGLNVSVPTRPEIVFPSGEYLISDEINVDGGVLRGEGEAAIVQSNSVKDIITSQDAWRMTISGLSFVAGRNHINLNNADTDGGFILIEESRFFGADGVAVNLGPTANSTQLQVQDSVFIDNEQALVSYTEQTKLSDSWISTGADMVNKAVIENRGERMTLENILGVPIGVVGTADQRWIDNHGSDALIIRNFRFGGEGGGFTPVVNFAQYVPGPLPDGLGPSILIEGSEIYAINNHARLTAIYLEEIPNGITFRLFRGICG